MFRPHTFNMPITVVGFSSQGSSSPPSCFPSGSDGKESACSAGDLGLIPGSLWSPGEENGNPLQYCCLEISMGRGAFWATVHGWERVGHGWVTNTYMYSTFTLQIIDFNLTWRCQLGHFPCNSLWQVCCDSRLCSASTCWADILPEPAC